MADQLYLSLWYPNFKLIALPLALKKVLEQLGTAVESERVKSATVYPLSWHESPVYQRIYDGPQDEEASRFAQAVADATDLLHEDYAYEFEVTWPLWTPEVGGGLEPKWTRQPHRVSVIGFGPAFDDGAWEQNGTIRIDFGDDTPFLQPEIELDKEAASRVKQNVQMLVDFTNAIQNHCGISSRLLWSESGESLVEKLIARLQSVN